MASSLSPADASVENKSKSNSGDEDDLLQFSSLSLDDAVQNRKQHSRESGQKPIDLTAQQCYLAV